ncbi:hypothetical protein ACFQDZ_23310 [Sulfitobacter pacificus]|uniref:hypothetical protein n=1 Tax=Sulfitobacter pacificus TaxID=1499314 RepID=UPI003607B804
MTEFNAGTYGVILRDVSDSDVVNSEVEKGSVIRDIYASGGGLPGEHHVSGSWIRLDNSANGNTF